MEITKKNICSLQSERMVSVDKNLRNIGVHLHSLNMDSHRMGYII